MIGVNMWQSRLRQASFKGMPFGVESHSSTQGRRVQIHEYPLRDDPYIEDLGKRAKEFSITGFVVGKNYMADRDRLLDACNQGGVGQLVHPYLGVKFVVCTAVSVSESADDGGVARFELSFVESGKNQFPIQANDWVSRLLKSIDELDDKLGNWFKNQFDINGLPEWLNTQTMMQFADSLNRLSDLSSLIPIGKFNDFIKSVVALKNGVNNISRLPRDIADRVLGVFDDLAGGFNVPVLGINSLKKSFAYNNGHNQGRGVHLSKRNAEHSSFYYQNMAEKSEKNQRALRLLFEIGAFNTAVATAVLKPDQPANKPVLNGFMKHNQQEVNSAVSAQNSENHNFNSLDEVLSVRSDLLNWLDDLIKTVPDDLFIELQAVRVNLVQALPDKDKVLPRVNVVQADGNLPLLVFAYQVHGNAEKAGEILRDNHIANPLFLPNKGLKVLLN